jgi:Protein of unknown function (DUF2934)
MHPEHRSIGELAYRLWQARGCPEGTAEQDWLDAERQLKSSQRTAESRATEPRVAEPRAAKPTASDALDKSLQATFPASDPPASQRTDQPPANADAKWKAAGAPRAGAAARPRRSKSTQGKPRPEAPG